MNDKPLRPREFPFGFIVLFVVFLLLVALFGSGCAFIETLRAEQVTCPGERSFLLANELAHHVEVFINKEKAATLEPRTGRFWFKQHYSDTNAILLQLTVHAEDAPIIIHLPEYVSQNREMTDLAEEHVIAVNEKLVAKHSLK